MLKYPHQQAFLNSDVIAEALALNQGPLVFPGLKAPGLNPLSGWLCAAGFQAFSDSDF